MAECVARGCKNWPKKSGKENKNEKKNFIGRSGFGDAVCDSNGVLCLRAE